MIVVVASQHIVHGNLGDGEFPLAPIRSVDNVRQRNTAATTGCDLWGGGRRGGRVMRRLKIGLHGSECRSVAESQASQAWQLHAVRVANGA